MWAMPMVSVLLGLAPAAAAIAALKAEAGTEPGSGVSTPTQPARLLEDLRFGFALGALQPAGGLFHHFAPAPLAGFEASSAYHGPWRATALLHYAYLSARDAASGIPELHLLRAGAGLHLRPSEMSGLQPIRLRSLLSWLPGPGAGVSFSLVRAASLTEAQAQRYVFLAGNESEFGGYAYLRWEPPSNFADGKLTLHTDVLWEAVFSRPRLTHLPSLSFGAAWRWR